MRDDPGGAVIDYAAIEHDPALRRGVYGLTELTHYLSLERDQALSPSTVARWIAGISKPDTHQARRPDYSFADLISMLVVGNLVSLGLTLSEIRAAESHLRGRYELGHPFMSVRLKSDGVDVFY